MVARAGGNADERKPVRECGGRDDGQRSVAAGDTERVGAARDGVGDQRSEVVVGAQDDRVDAALARQLGEAGTRRLAAARLRVDEEDGPPRWIGGQVRRGQEKSVSATGPERAARFRGRRVVPEHEDVDERRDRRGERNGEDDGESAEQDADDRDGEKRDER